MAVDLGEDAINVDEIERGQFDCLPAGQYVVQIIESDVVNAKTGSGKILKFTFEVMEGDFAQRKLWLNLNYKNANATAQRIAQEQLKGICEAVGHAGHLTNTDVLEFKPLRAAVTIKNDPQYGERNEMKRFSAYNSDAPPASKAPPQPASGGTTSAAAPPPRQAAAGQSRPWGNRAA